MSLKIRDTLNNSGADNNPDHVGRTQLDNLNNSDTTLGNGSSSFLNPDFNPTELPVNETFPISAFPQVSSNLHSQWNTVAYLGTEVLSADNIVDYFLQYFPNLAQSDTKSDNERLAGAVNIIKNNEGFFYWPEFNFDGLGGLIPGQGYQIRVRDVPLQPNGSYLLGNRFKAYDITMTHDITRYEDLPDFSSYTNAINNIPVELHTQWNTIGFVRYNPQNLREALYKFFFPNGSNGHLLNDEGLPYDSTKSEDILGRTNTDIPIEYEKSKFATTGSCVSTIHNIYAHPTDTSSADTTLFRIVSYQGSATINFKAIDDSLFSSHDDIIYGNFANKSIEDDKNNIYHFKAGSSLLEGVTNLTEKINSILGLDTTVDVDGSGGPTIGVRAFKTAITTSVIDDGSDIKLKLDTAVGGTRQIDIVSSSFGGYLEPGKLASGSFDPGTISENNTIFKFEVGSEEYLFKGFRVSSSAEQDTRDAYNNVDKQFAFNTTQTPNSVIDQQDPNKHVISNSKKIDNLIKRVNEQNLVKINFNTNFKTNSDGSIQVNEDGSGITDYSKIIAIARNTAEDFNGIEIKKSNNNGSSYNIKTTLANGTLKGFFTLNTVTGGKKSWYSEYGVANQIQNNALIDIRLSDFINIVKNNEGLFYWPGLEFDGIGNFIPGQGYQVRIKEPYINVGTYKIDPRSEIQFPFFGKWPADGEVNTDPLIDGGPE